jgi:6-phosphogluconolactonase
MSFLAFGRNVLNASAAAAMLAGCGGSQPPVRALGAMPWQRPENTVSAINTVEFAYVTNFASDKVSGYRITGDGALTPVKGSPFRAGTGPTALAVDPTGKFAYVTNQEGEYGSVSAYAVDATSGVLTPVKGSPFLTGFAPDGVAIDPTGKFAYVTNYGKPSDGYVSAYIVNASGALKPVKGSPFTAGLGVNGVVVDPKGKFVYATTQYDGVFAYVINRISGALTAVKGSPFKAGVGPKSVAVVPTGKFAYVVNVGKLGRNTGTVSGYSVNASSGVLKQVKGSPFAAGTEPNGVAIDPTGSFIYVTNADGFSGSSGKVSAYTIDQNSGALAPVRGSPFGTDPSPEGVAVDPGGKFAYIADGAVSAYQIKSNGGLKPVKGSPFKSSYPVFISTCRVTSGRCVPPPL